MKKFFKLGKRMLALFIVVLLNINSYAAVGANDGSAFVTKAEFDALVNTFNEQMDTYQSGINAKIDGAIANYLAGLSSVSVKQLKWANNGQYVYIGINDEDVEEGYPILSFTSVNSMTYGGSSTTMLGLSGYFDLTSKGKDGKWIIATNIGSNGKDVIIRGYGPTSESWVVRSDANHSTNQNTPVMMDGRSRRYQLNWTNVTSGSTALDVEPTYHSYYDSNHTWLPKCFGLNPDNDGRVFDLSTRLITFNKNVSISKQNLYVVNDELEITTVYDDTDINGFMINPVLSANMASDTYGKFNIKVVLHAVANDGRSGNTSVPYQLVSNHGWTAEGSYGAGLTITNFNTTPQTSTMFETWYNGKNNILCGSYIEKPQKLFVNNFISEEKFCKWLTETNGIPADAWIKYKDENIDMYKDEKVYYNLRYGIPMVLDGVKDATYSLTVKNESDKRVGIKIFNELQSTVYNDVTGIKTNVSESAADAKNEIMLSANASKNITFTVTKDAPIFFKCSDGVKLTFSEKITESQS